MTTAPLRAVLDANVLFPFTLRDTLLRAADEGMFQISWSEEILDETRRNLVATGTATGEQASRLVAVMKRAFPDAMVAGHEALIANMPNDLKDRHVAAAAVYAGAPVIVTSNLRDFRELPQGVQAQSPDTFLLQLFSLDPDAMLDVVTAQAEALKRPPRTFAEIVIALGKIVPGFANAVREHADHVSTP